MRTEKDRYTLNMWTEHITEHYQIYHIPAYTGSAFFYHILFYQVIRIQGSRNVRAGETTVDYHFTNTRIRDLEKFSKFTKN